MYVNVGYIYLDIKQPGYHCSNGAMVDYLTESLKSSQSTPDSIGFQHGRSSFHRQGIWSCTQKHGCDKLSSHHNI